MSDPSFIFVVDTEQYAGNFERELCAYMTGQIGECGVGDDYAAMFTKELPDVSFENIIGEFIDDRGCHRPAEIQSTPNWFNNGMGYQYQDTEDGRNAAVKAYREAEYNYYKGQKQKMEDRIARQDFEPSKLGAWDKDACERTLAGILEKFAAAEAMTVPPKYPAYLSVGIAFNSEPNAEQIALLKERAYAFTKFPRNSWDEKINITGFRLIQNVVLSKETNI